MTAPRCSMIIAVKNGEDHIATTLASLARQYDDPRDLEVIVIDDGSTDATSAIAAEWSDRLPGLAIVRWEESRGVGSGRVHGLSLARGETVGFVDGDDWMAPGRLPALERAISDLDVDFVRTDHIRTEGAVRTVARAPEGRRGVVLDPRDAILPPHASTMIDYPFPWAGLFHRRLVDTGVLAYDEGLHTAEDRVAAWRFHLGARAFAVVAAPPIFYRRGVATSLTQVYDARQLDFTRGFALMHDLVAADPDAEAFMPKLLRQFLAITAHHVDRGGMDKATRAELKRRVSEVASTFPQDELARQLESSPRARRVLLAPLLSVDHEGSPS